MDTGPFLRNPSNRQNNLRFGKFVNKATFAKNLGVVLQISHSNNLNLKPFERCSGHLN